MSTWDEYDSEDYDEVLELNEWKERWLWQNLKHDGIEDTTFYRKPKIPSEEGYQHLEMGITPENDFKW